MAVLNFYKIGKTIPENGVYIGRENTKLGLKGSPFANPFPITDSQPREVVLKKYKRWLWNQMEAGKIKDEDLLALKGKDLVCFCAPQPCHGHIIEAAIDWVEKKNDPSRRPKY